MIGHLQDYTKISFIHRQTLIICSQVLRRSPPPTIMEYHLIYYNNKTKKQIYLFIFSYRENFIDHFVSMSVMEIAQNRRNNLKFSGLKSIEKNV